MSRERQNPRREGGVVPTDPEDFGRVGWPVEANQNAYTPAVAKFFADYDGPATARHICIYLNISPATFYAWIADEPEFAAAVAAARDRNDDDVEAALFRRAKGFVQPESKVKRKFMRVVKERDEDTGAPIDYEEIEVERTEQIHEKHFEPDVAAVKFWLSNRRRDSWSDRRVIEDNRDHAGLVEKFFAALPDVTPAEDDDE